MKSKMDIPALHEFLRDYFPQAVEHFAVINQADGNLTVQFKVQEQHLRPGNTVSGPTIFTLADVAVYLAIIARIGPVALAVTTNGSIDFMRKPVAGRDLICQTDILKLGRSLAVGDARIFSEGTTDLVARATLTYAIPPKP